MRLNLNKRSSSVSVGGKGLYYTTASRKNRGKGFFYYLFVFPIKLIINPFIWFFGGIFKTLRSIWSTATSTKDGKRAVLIILAILLGVCCVCSLGITVLDQVDLIDLSSPTATQLSTSTLAPASATPPDPTVTLLSLTTPSATLVPLSLPISSTTPTFQLGWTNTPLALKTNTRSPAIQPSATTVGSTYVCSSNLYNCSSFSTQKQAQAVYDYCISQGAGDIHRLDGTDNDGKVCEALP